jgi:nucleotide-binding universal stress UspA family protein
VSQELIDRSEIPVLVARRPTVDRVLVGADPAGSSDEAVAFLRRHGLLGATSAKVVSVVTPMYPWWIGVADAGGVVGEGFGAVHDTAEAATHAAIETTLAALRAPGREVDGECHEGMVSDELERSIAAWDADIAVIGSRRRSALGALVLGSVARNVVHRAASSVLVVHPARPAVPRAPRPAVEPVAPDPKEHPMKILLAYDGDPSAERALQTAAKMAQAFGGTIDVVSVIPFRAGRGPMAPWDDRETHDLELQDAVRRLAMLGLTCTTIEPVGAVAPEIERVAREGSYDLVVVGSRGLGTLDRLLQGSVGEHVATHAATTVVVAR